MAKPCTRFEARVLLNIEVNRKERGNRAPIFAIGTRSADVRGQTEVIASQLLRPNLLLRRR
jgi:hypothetical protein